MKTNRHTDTAAAAQSPTRTDVLAAYLRKRHALQADDTPLRNRQIELEDAETVPVEPGKSFSPDHDAKALLNGSAPESLAAGSSGEELFSILRKRAAIKRALELLDDPIKQARILAAAEMLAENRAAWREITRARIDALLALRAANAAAFKFKAAMQQKAPDFLYWPGDHGAELFYPDLSGEAQQFLERSVDAGFATKKEIER